MTLWFWALSAIAGSILGGATNAWFENTKMGKWFYKKMEQFYDWAADRYNLKILDTENAWRKKYPNIAYQMDSLEKRISELERR